MEIFERAARAKLRYGSSVGVLNTEQLFDLPLIAKGDKPSLETVAQQANRELKGLGDESFVEVKENPIKSIAALKLEVVKYVIAAKQADEAAAVKRAETVAYKQQLLNALASKGEQKLAGMSEEDIKKELEKLAAA